MRPQPERRRRRASASRDSSSALRRRPESPLAPPEMSSTTSYDAATLGLFVRRLERYEPGVAEVICAIVAHRRVPVFLVRHSLLRTLLPVTPLHCCLCSPVWEPLIVACMADLPVIVYNDLCRNLPAVVAKAFGGDYDVLPNGRGIVVRDKGGQLLGWVCIEFIVM